MRRLFPVLAMSCVLAITGCAWMVNWMAKEPLPPQIHPLSNMHVISLTVVNRTDSKHLPPEKVRADVVKRLNLRSSGVIFTGDDGTKADGTLAISILEESGEQTKINQKTGDVTWKFGVKFSAELRQPSGRVVWSRPERDVTQIMTYDSPIPRGVNLGWGLEIETGALVPQIADTLAADLVHLR
jgi:hypothetical protein